MSETPTDVARELAHKVIAWRNEAIYQQSQHDRVRKESQRITWKALDRLTRTAGEEISDAFSLPYAWIHERLLIQMEPLTEDEAAAIMRRFCQLIDRELQKSHRARHFMQTTMPRWPQLLAALEDGGFEDHHTWVELMQTIKPPGLTKALLDLVYSAAPVPNGSDSVLARS